MNVGEDLPAGSGDAVSKSRAIEARAEAEVTKAYRRASYFGSSVVDAGQFILFSVYFLTAILRFWLLFLTLIIHLVRVVIRLLTLPLQWTSGAWPPRLSYKIRPIASGNLATILRYELIVPLGYVWAEAMYTLRSFWHYTFERKTLVVALTFFLVFVPATYLVPRPHTVQILDNNVLNNQTGAQGANAVGYLIHAIDVNDPTHTREYMNESAWWLGKVNSQGLKARLVPGRYFKMWVIGLRWWYLPTLYPNIITATETDAHGKVLEHPSTFIPVTTTGQ